MIEALKGLPQLSTGWPAGLVARRLRSADAAIAQHGLQAVVGDLGIGFPQQSLPQFVRQGGARLVGLGLLAQAGQVLDAVDAAGRQQGDKQDPLDLLHGASRPPGGGQ